VLTGSLIQEKTYKPTTFCPLCPAVVRHSLCKKNYICLLFTQSSSGCTCHVWYSSLPLQGVISHENSRKTDVQIRYLPWKFSKKTSEAVGC